MITLGDILQHLNTEFQDAGNEDAATAIEQIVAAMEYVGGAQLEEHLSRDGDVLDDWVKLGNRAPREGELVLVARQDDVFADGPDNAFVGRYWEDSGVAGWAVKDEVGSYVKPAYDDDEWKRF